MPLSEFNAVYLPLINTLVSLTGVVTIVILIKQYRKENKWRKLQSPYNFIGIGEEFAIQEKLYRTYHKLGVYSFPEKCKALTPAQVRLISENLEATLITNMFLNHLQNLCTAHRFGLVDEAVFKGIHASRICWWYTILKPYIVQRQKDYKNQKIWNEFSDTALNCLEENALT
jgi:hypothetical protein